MREEYEEQRKEFLTKALLEKRFEPWLQPQYDNVTGMVIGAEALVRLRDGDRILSPGSFIGDMERFGLIFELDCLVWSQVCRFQHRLMESGKKAVPISVNISRYDAVREDLVEVLLSIIEKEQIPKEALHLEISEAALTESSGEVLKKIIGLSELGFIIEIDGFGRGHNSLNVLKDLKASILKLDMRDFVSPEREERSGIIIESIVRMASWLGMSVIAEGVEEKRQVDYLHSIGCDFLQGYYCAKPMALADYQLLVQSSQKHEKLLQLRTVQNLNNNDFWNPNSMDTLIFNSYVGGACIFEYFNGKTELLRVNDQYTKELGFFAEMPSGDLGRGFPLWLSKGNKEKMLRNIEKAIATGKSSGIELFLRYGKHSEYIRTTVRTIANTNGRHLLYCAILNVTEQREAEKRQRQAEKKQFELAEQLFLIADSIPGGIAKYQILKTRVNTLYLSEGVPKQTGYSEDEYLERTKNDVMAIVFPEDRELIRNEIQLAKETGSQMVFPFRIRNREGELRWLVFRGSLSLKKGKVLLNVAFFDITEKKLADEKLLQNQKETELRYEHELSIREEMMRDSMLYFTLNLSENVVEEYQDRLNLFPGKKGMLLKEDILNNTIMKKVMPKDQERIRNTFYPEFLLDAYAQHKNNISLLYRRKMNETETHWMRVTATITKRPPKDDIIVFLYILDVDKERKNQLAMSSVLDEAIESVSILNIRSGLQRFVKVKEPERYGQWTQEFCHDTEMLRQIKSRVFREDQKRCEKELSKDSVIKHLSENKTHVVTFRVVGENGEIRWKRSIAFYLDETHEDIVFSDRDITQMFEEEQRQKQLLQNAVDEANRANKAKSDFLSRMSHDMRTPLNGIIGLSELSKDEKNPEKLRTYLENIDISSHFLLGLINDVLDIGKIESGKLLLKEELVTAEEFQKSIETVMCPLMEQKGIHFIMKLSNSIPCVLGDKLRLTQIFFNLLSNAAKFTEKDGTIEFLQFPLADKNGKKGIRFLVRDTGIGMSKEFMKKMFDPFEQEQSKKTENITGSGLGLSIVKKLVDAMDGAIAVKSEINKGTEFTIDLYLKEGILPETKTPKTKEFHLEGVRILLVEDNEINRLVAQNILETKGCLVTAKTNGKEGLTEFLLSVPGEYDVILMDIRMPVMNGMTATTEIRNSDHPDAKTIPIIAMTADAFADDEKELLSCGLNGKILKPIETDVLFRVISSFRRRNRDENKFSCEV